MQASKGFYLGSAPFSNSKQVGIVPELELQYIKDTFYTIPSIKAWVYPIWVEGSGTVAYRHLFSQA